MNKFFATFAIAVFTQCAAAGAAYDYWQTFEDDSDTYTPSVVHDPNEVYSGSPPAGWSDRRTANFDGLIEEVPNGFGGIDVGPHGGGHFAVVRGTPLNNFALYQAYTAEAGTRSVQVDLYVGLDNQGTSPSFWIDSADVRRDGAGNQMAIQTVIGGFGGFNNVTGVTTYTLYDWYRGDFRVELEGDSWYTLEWFYHESEATDPGTGEPFLGRTFNVYRQAELVNGFRSADLVYTDTSLYGDVNTAGYPPVPAEGTYSPYHLSIRGGPNLFIDNIAAGPIINTPEPGGVLSALGFTVTTLLRRRRPSR